MDFTFDRPRANKISKEKMLEALIKTAEAFHYKEFRGSDFEKISGMSADTIFRNFGTWKNALGFLNENLKKKGLTLEPRTKRRFSEKELFDEMERIWKEIGHRPSPGEWERFNPKISTDTYQRYFGGWQNACLKFIEYKMGNVVISDEELIQQPENNNQKSQRTYTQEDSRGIPAGLKVKVLDRDNFRCVFCGKSPATDFGTKLHIDHIIPFSKGGKSNLENLQTLCEECNLGKSNRDIGLEFSRQRKT